MSTKKHHCHQEILRRGPRGGHGHRPYDEVPRLDDLKARIVEINTHQQCPNKELALKLAQQQWDHVQRELQKNMRRNLSCPKCQAVKGEGLHIRTEERSQEFKQLCKVMKKVPVYILGLEGLDELCCTWETFEHNCLIDHLDSQCDGLFWEGNEKPPKTYYDSKDERDAATSRIDPDSDGYVPGLLGRYRRLGLAAASENSKMQSRSKDLKN
jgi:hypothetical protein